MTMTFKFPYNYKLKKKSMFSFSFFSSEKLLVVLLVASGTVCVLTNALIVVVLLRQKGRLCLRLNMVFFFLEMMVRQLFFAILDFRYQIMLSQALAGILGTSVIFYPLKVSNWKVLYFSNIFI